MKKIISPITGKSKYLLIENCEVISNIKIANDLKESLKLSTGKTGTLIVKNLPGTILNRENQNGRIYSTEVLAQAIREAKPLFETKQCLSQADEHPEGSFVAPTHASHVVTNAYIKKNVDLVVDGERGTFDMLFMDIEVLNTEEGKNLRALLEAECSVGTSIRGVGDMEGKYVKNYEILGIDFVGNPSSSTYTRMPVSESVKIELKDPRNLQETFTVTTSSTNVVRDLEQAAIIQQQLENIGYGTVTKTSTKLDQETDPKTGAQTSITTLEAETSDDVSDLDQALQMAKNAMLNGTTHVDSITIENIPEEGEKESVDQITPTLKEEDDTTEKIEKCSLCGSEELYDELYNMKTDDNQRCPVCDHCQRELISRGEVEEEDFTPLSQYDFEIGTDETVKYVPENTTNKKITEAKKEDEEDPNLGKKFVLHTDRGFVTFDKNAIDFTDKPEDALHFREGKEESGMVSMSKVTEILDAMGIFDVKKYFQTNDIDLGKDAEEPKDIKKEGLLGGIAGGIIGNQIGSGYPIAGAALGSIAQDATTKDESTINEENGNNTKYRANITIQDENGTNNEGIAISSIDLEGAQKEIANLYNMKKQTIKGSGNLTATLIDTISGEQFNYNPETQTLDLTNVQNDNIEEATTETCVVCEKEFEPSELEDLQGVKVCKKCYQLATGDDPLKEDSDLDVKIDKNKVTTKLDNNTTLEKEFENPLQAQVATAAVAKGKADPSILIPEASEVNEKLYSNPSEPSDEYKKEPLEDAITEDFIVTLGNIDWNIDNVDPKFLSKIESLPDTYDIRVQGTTIDTADSPEELKAAILAGANETMSPFGINDGTVVAIKDTKTGEVLA